MKGSQLILLRFLAGWSVLVGESRCSSDSRESQDGSLARKGEGAHWKRGIMVKKKVRARARCQKGICVMI